MLDIDTTTPWNNHRRCVVAYTKAGKKERWAFNFLICGFEVISQLGPPLRVVFMRSSGEHKYLDVAAQF